MMLPGDDVGVDCEFEGCGLSVILTRSAETADEHVLVESCDWITIRQQRPLKNVSNAIENVLRTVGPTHPEEWWCTR